MNTVIQFTPVQLWTGFLAFCVAVVSISAAIGVVAKLIEFVKKPETSQNKTLKEHEEWLKRHDATLKTYEGYFDADKKRLDSIEEGNRVTQKAILALLSHALNGNDIESLQDAKTSLEKYLLNR